ncbi:response regulator [Shewanella baltica]|uniref:Response regulator receiver modulated metal dependent phosphohydrolase n=1 Tax=Shewanella baltica (strain OS155 / ATCC BAA-1091) TaxID=325240 RepID=A3D945_SHEB5|nr:response regulator [Shewanella baltica]ABN63258.1 response regulator receiver modulated metal dependent phosphohydrolase [Shewanella baltica OS155]AEH15606.1 response regulator receiver modulated metal dependent phosphohydrolase [Shewanella baltica OS117]
MSDFLDDWLTEDTNEKIPNQRVWNVLVVDDEPDIVNVTKLTLSSFTYKNKTLNVQHAYSAAEAAEIISNTTDLALILLDVVMETDDAGLKLVKWIRDELGNNMVRIVLRTGQPGYAPEKSVIIDYDINDYKLKTDLTAEKLFTVVIASLRAYESLWSLEENRIGLMKILEGTSSLYRIESLKQFASGILDQISLLLKQAPEGILVTAKGMQAKTPDRLTIIAATGLYESFEADDQGLINQPTLTRNIALAHKHQQSVFQHPHDVLRIPSHNGHTFFIYFSPIYKIDTAEQALLEIFCERMSAAYDNFHLFGQLKKSQEASIVAMASLAEHKDEDTGWHVLRVRDLTEAIANELLQTGHFTDELTPGFLSKVGWASILHDIGKIGIKDSILQKKGKLDNDERSIMETHAHIGEDILFNASKLIQGRNYFSIAAQIAGGHHEYFDGHGYPRGLSGDHIPLCARIVAVVDVFDALLSDRPYKTAWPLNQAIDYIIARSSTQFDPRMVQALLTLLKEKRLSPELCEYYGLNTQ